MNFIFMLIGVICTVAVCIIISVIRKSSCGSGTFKIHKDLAGNEFINITIPDRETQDLSHKKYIMLKMSKEE